MKSAVYLGKESIEIREIPIPAVGDNDVLIKNIYSSICGTDIAVYTHGTGTGHKINVGGEFGHETVSRVVKIGKNITDLRIGDRVYPYPLYAKNDTSRAGTLGGFSEYILISEAKLNHSLYLVPEIVSDKTACLIEPFTVGCRAARRSQPQKGDTAVVFGCGTIGLAAAIALKYFGLDKVMICDISDFRLSTAAQLDFKTCNTSKEDFFKTSSEYFGKAISPLGESVNCDIFIDAAGAESVLDLFMKYGKIESRFTEVAVNNSLRTIDLLALTYAQKSIIGSGGYMPEDVHDVLEIMKSGAWDIEKIITHEFTLNELPQALETASDTKHAFNVIIGFGNE